MVPSLSFISKIVRLIYGISLYSFVWQVTAFLQYRVILKFDITVRISSVTLNDLIIYRSCTSLVSVQNVTSKFALSKYFRRDTGFIQILAKNFRCFQKSAVTSK